MSAINDLKSLFFKKYKMGFIKRYNLDKSINLRIKKLQQLIKFKFKM
jgi:hypothetical protein